ncbi:MAG: hypothetical protein KF709_12700 [Gemmatimonadaceae bacterium]|nr:hypothetical protein [Gemmatimonadaceae bacterium]
MGLAGGVNQYGYVGGDPVNFSDPFGLCGEKAGEVEVNGKCLDAKAAIGVVVGAAMGAIGRGLGMLRQAAASRRAAQAASLADDVSEVHGALDPVAQSMRTTAVLETNGGRIAAGGARDLTPAQRGAAASRGLQTAAAPGVHAEQTALQAAFRAGFKPDALAVSRPMCSNCQAAVTASGGQVTSPTTAVWP